MLAPENREQASISIMGREANIDLIRALEKRIGEGKGDTIKLKRERNSLLNISTRLPPEILGQIFTWNLVREGFFRGLREGSYNFLLVCHHWLEVASRTPELWNFWGNTLQDWKKRYDCPRATALDLVLNEHRHHPAVLFDESLQKAIRSHVMQDTIRQVHLRSDDYNTLTSIISSLTPDDEGGRNENIESIFWQHWRVPPDPTVNVSNFFARSRLSKLRSLTLHGNFWISSWDCLAPRTTLLTTLSLDISPFPLSVKISPFPMSPTITTSQLFSILTSNLNLRKLKLFNSALPNDTDTSTLKVQLRDLKSLSLRGELHHVFGLYCRLILPEALDEVCLDISDTLEAGIPAVVQYIRDYFRHDPRFQHGPTITYSSRDDLINISNSLPAF